jgi:hypothetical protein
VTYRGRRTLVEARGPSPGELVRRVVVLLFAVVQGSIALRLVFLLIDANRANFLVSTVLNVSQVFVGPFDGILNTNGLRAGGSVLDLTAVVALVVWSILEPVAIAAAAIFVHERG